MKRLTCVTVAVLLLGGSFAAAAPSQWKADKSKKQARTNYEQESGDPRGDVQVVFTSADVTIIRNHYAPRYRSLPPGLQKKIARGGQLPPGWQKRFEPFPPSVENRLAPLPHEYRRGVIDGHAVIYNTRSRIVIDVAVLF